MTFCLGMKIEAGLVGIADTRITSGSDFITARKLSIHQYGHHSMFLMTSGLRSVRDKAVTYFEEVIEEQSATFDKLYKVTNAFAEQVRRVAREDKAALEENHVPFNLHALVGGQLELDKEPKLYQLYPEGNWVEISRGTPFFIIGSYTYGKPLLDRVLRFDCSLEVALKAGYLAFNATRKSSNNVAFPIDIVVYKKDSFKMETVRYEEDDLREISDWWQRHLETGLKELPTDWLRAFLARLE
jgi:putative proteasome-type protease